MSIPQKIGEEKIVYQGKIIEVVEQCMKIWDKEKVFEFARRSPGTRMIVVNEHNEILITKEWRSELNDYDYRLPGGKVFDTLEEYTTSLQHQDDILQHAIQWVTKEAQEECWIAITNPELFAISKCGATVVWDLYYFVVTNFTELEHNELEEGEHIVGRERMTSSAVKILCLSDQFSEERSALILLKYLETHT